MHLKTAFYYHSPKTYIEYFVYISAFWPEKAIYMIIINYKLAFYSKIIK